MLFTLLVAIFINPLRPCEGSPTFQEEYRTNYKPKFLYFLDTRFNPATAKHIKEQIERATIVGGPHETNKTLFVFDPLYARVLFAKGLNRHNPALKLPEFEPSGDWLVTYNVGSPLSG
ncbi:hypothetical protein LY78DRAFT_708320 [Colletotrichum sublineola]|nr:hypothetical protein LY78DRAFT_708320 [Colletotrichum sublineola]